MSTFNDFTNWLFPGDDIHTRNPSTVPGAAKEILEMVSCATGIDEKWLQKSARLVLDGLAGCGCLWYLHGANGTIENIIEERDWPNWMHDFVGAARIEMLERLSKKDPHVKWVGVGADYGAGKLEFGIQYDDGRPTKVRTEKIGKLLRKMGYIPEVIKEFETRQLEKWDWFISTHPFDVLTMSFNRPWTSCMRPGGVAELGPLTDMAAGSAVMFFTRPGADKPCGRLILRPVIGFEQMDPNMPFPAIASGKIIYGCGPDHIDKTALQTMLAEATGEHLKVVEIPICKLGKDGRMLTRFIYSDTDRNYCKQTDTQYEQAYFNLLERQWPESRLEIGDLPLKAKEAVALVGEFELDSAENLINTVREIANIWIGQGSGSRLEEIVSTLQALNHGNIPTSEDYKFISDECGFPYDEELIETVNNMFEERLYEILDEYLAKQKTYVFLIAEPEDYYSDPFQTMYDNEIHGHLVNSLDHIDRIIQEYIPANIDYDDIWRIVAVPEDFYPHEFVQYAKKEGLLLAEIKIPAGVYEWGASDFI